jgi:hypothetical protein
VFFAKQEPNAEPVWHLHGWPALSMPLAMKMPLLLAVSVLDGRAVGTVAVTVIVDPEPSKPARKLFHGLFISSVNLYGYLDGVLIVRPCTG